MDWDKASVELGKKLDPKNVQPAKQFGPKGEYIEGWFAMDEANRIFGHGGWSYSLIDCKPVMQAERKIGKAQKDGWGVTYVATVRVIVGEVTREDVGAGHGYDADLGLAHESAIKEAVTDAFKRAVRGFGYPFGLALYDKSREHVGVDDPPADIALRDKMLRGLSDRGAALAEHPKFKADLETLRGMNAEAAAEIDARINQMKEAA